MNIKLFFFFFDLTQFHFDNRDQLIQQLEKSQDMLMNFQQELNATEQELQRQREENKRLALQMRLHCRTCLIFRFLFFLFIG